VPVSFNLMHNCSGRSKEKERKRRWIRDEKEEDRMV
jgi:hypothetical protein